MNNINILINNENKTVQVVRYFENQDSRYLIYSLNEKDEQGYIKLYAVKVVESDGVLIGAGIIDDNEWMNVKNIIKVIVKENKEGKPVSVRDLDVSKLVGFPINDGRIFKLGVELANMLSANQVVYEERSDSNLVIPTEEVSTIPTEEVSTIPTEEIKPVEMEPIPVEINVEPNPAIQNFEPVNIDSNIIVNTELDDLLPKEEPNIKTEAIPDYKAMYEEQLSKNNELVQIIEQLENKLESIKTILD